MTEQGHNGSGDRVKSYVERVERLEEEKANLTADISEVLKEAANAGFDKKIIKEIVKIRKNKEKYEESLALVSTYMRDMGQQLDFNFGARASSNPGEEVEAA